MIITNSSKLIETQVLTQISHPLLESPGGFNGGYLTTWDGKAKHGIGPGGIKYNVKVGSPCFGWPESEHLEPGVSLKEVEAKPTPYQSPSSFATTMKTICCIGNQATLVSGDSKGKRGVIVGKTNRHVLAQFPEETLNDLTIGDRVRIKAVGVGLRVEGFKGEVYNMSPETFESLRLNIENERLVFPVTHIIPAHAMGSGVGGSEAQQGTMSIQSNPPSLVEELRLGNLKIGDFVALQDILIQYGKGYYRGAISVGVITTGASDNAGHGPAVLALAASKTGMIHPILDAAANLTRNLRL
jgi:hypothetical protein